MLSSCRYKKKINSTLLLLLGFVSLAITGKAAPPTTPLALTVKPPLPVTASTNPSDVRSFAVGARCQSLLMEPNNPSIVIMQVVHLTHFRPNSPGAVKMVDSGVFQALETLEGKPVTGRFEFHNPKEMYLTSAMFRVGHRLEDNPPPTFKAEVGELWMVEMRDSMVDKWRCLRLGGLSDPAIAYYRHGLEWKHATNPAEVIADIKGMVKKSLTAPNSDISALLFFLGNQFPRNPNLNDRTKAIARQYHQAILDLLTTPGASNASKIELINAGSFQGVEDLKPGSLEAIWLRGMMNIVLNSSDNLLVSAAGDALSGFMASSRTMVPSEHPVQYYYPEIIATLDARVEIDKQAGHNGPASGVIGNMKLMGIYDPPSKPGSNLSTPGLRVFIKSIPPQGNTLLEQRIAAVTKVRN